MPGKLKNKVSFGDKFPNIAKEWHLAKNKPLTPNSVTPFSGKIVWWKCKNGHEWNQKISRRTSKKQTCTSCKSILYSHPEIAKEWHPTKNSKKNIMDFSFGSEEYVWWIDDEGYEWESSCYKRVKSKNKSLLNPSKANRNYHSIVRVNADNQLSTNFPNLIKQWHPKNDRGPETFTIKSAIRVWWLCENGHEWKTTISHRTGGTNCPYCSKSSTSRPELRILSELRTIFDFEIRLRDKIFKREIDIYIPKFYFGIEYDGIYYHKNKYKKDKEKSEFLNKKKIVLIRVRVEGLKKYRIQTFSLMMGI